MLARMSEAEFPGGNVNWYHLGKLFGRQCCSWRPHSWTQPWVHSPESKHMYPSENMTQNSPGAVFTEPTTGTNPSIHQHMTEKSCNGIKQHINKNDCYLQRQNSDKMLNKRSQTQDCIECDSNDRKFKNKCVHGQESQRSAPNEVQGRACCVLVLSNIQVWVVAMGTNICVNIHLAASCSRFMSLYCRP